jgi:predicted SpoU family rRNA methylase
MLLGGERMSDVGGLERAVARALAAKGIILPPERWAALVERIEAVIEEVDA